MFKRDLVRYVALCAGALIWFGAAPAGEVLPYQLAGDVSESYRLLTTTYYEKVDPRAILAAASAALADAARKAGTPIPAPALQVESDRDATVAELDEAIAAAARAAHASPNDFAYAAINAMAKAVNDRYTQFFTPAEFKAFNEALDPARIGGIGVMIQPDTDVWFRSHHVRVPEYARRARRPCGRRSPYRRKWLADEGPHGRRRQFAAARQSRHRRRGNGGAPDRNLGRLDYT